MQGRSWMAALALTAGVTLAAYAGDPQAPAQDESVVVNEVTLVIRVNGLEQEGCEVEVKPGHPGCDFKPFKKKVDSPGGVGQFEVAKLQVKSTRKDRDCLFAITITQPGQLPKTSYRSIQVLKPTAIAPIPTLSKTLLLQSPALAAREDVTKRTK
jgi:hypothetical protein